MSYKSCVVIPARYKSSRFPGKPLSKINNKELIIWVAELSALAVGKENVYIATEDIRIKSLVEGLSYNCIMTDPSALTGTDRVAEAALKLDYEIIINVQGDEPLVDPLDIKKCINIKSNNFNKIINGFTWLKKDEDPKNINIPKVITTEQNKMIYISRSPLPSSKETLENDINYKKQVCIYGFNKLELAQFKNHGKKSYLELIEDIEILRFLEFGKEVLMFECNKVSLAVDVPEDIQKVENYLNKIYE